MQRSYTLFWNAMSKQPEGGVRVAAEIPEAWTEVVDAKGAPAMTVPGLDLPGPMLAARACRGRPFAECVDAMIDPGAERTELGDGRVWTVHRSGNGGITARMFVPAPATDSVVTCMIVLPAALAGRIDELRGFAESIRIME